MLKRDGVLEQADKTINTKKTTPDIINKKKETPTDTQTTKHTTTKQIEPPTDVRTTKQSINYTNLPKTITLKDYKITLLKKLGSGGFSEVYDGLVSNRQYAIKKLVKRTSNSDGSKDDKVNKWLEQVTKEGNVGCNLRHKNIIKTVHHGAYEEGHSLYGYIIIMEKAINIDLNKFIQSHVNPTFYRILFGFNQLSDNFCRFFLAQCLNASFYFYICELIHLDIKPENYLLNKDFTIKLSDFSLVISMHNTPEDFTFKGLSSPSYMAPEFMLGKKVKREEAYKADIYSIGITLFYMKFHKRLVPKNCMIDKNTVQMAKDEKDKTIEEAVEKGTLNKECGDLIKLFTEQDYKKRPDIYQALNNDWINQNKSKIKHVQLYNEGDPLKFCLEMQKSDYISSITRFSNRKYKFKTR